MAGSPARGAGLIGAAVIVGIILLQVIDDGGGTSGGGDGANGSNGSPVTSETTPTTAEGQRSPSEVPVVVLNAGQPTGSALNKTNALRLAGYNMQAPGNDPVAREGVAVQCTEEFEAEAAALALAVQENATVEAYPAEVPAGAENAECIVLLGQT
jgi:hypothetical protein